MKEKLLANAIEEGTDYKTMVEKVEIELTENQDAYTIDGEADVYLGNGQTLNELTIQKGPVSIENLIINTRVNLPKQGEVTFTNVNFGSSVKFETKEIQVKDEDELEAVKFFKFTKPDKDATCYDRSKAYFRIFFFCYGISQIWTIIGALIFQSLEAPHYDELVTDCNDPLASKSVYLSIFPHTNYLYKYILILKLFLHLYLFLLFLQQILKILPSIVKLNSHGTG